MKCIYLLIIVSLIAIVNSTRCVQFTPPFGTSCDFMCRNCYIQLGTNDFYFTDGVCQVTSQGCIGTPMAGMTYTCCTLSNWLPFGIRRI